MSDIDLEGFVSQSVGGKFDVCFSYASEDRASAEQLGAALKKRKAAVFDYRAFEGELALIGKNLFDELAKIYQRTPFCVIFVSQHYVGKFWTRDEFESIKKYALKKRDCLIPVCLDDAELEDLPPGLRREKIGPGETGLEQLADLIAHRVIQYKKRRRLQRISAASAALLIVLALIAGTCYVNRPSNTHVAVLDKADSAHIYAQVWNTGGKPSELMSYWLKFGRLPVGGGESATVNEAELRPSRIYAVKDANIIEPGSKVTIALFLDELSGLPKPGRPERYNVDEISNQLGDDPVTLEICVKESNDDDPRLCHKRPASIASKKIEAFIAGRMQ
jgi:hypothetical protein